MTIVAIVLAGLAAACAIGPRPEVVRLRRALGATDREAHGRLMALRNPRRRGRRGARAGTDHHEADGVHPPSGSGSSSGRHRFRIPAAVVAGSAVALFVPGPAMIVVGPVVGVAAWWLLGRVESTDRARVRRRLDIDLPLAAELLAAAITAGCSVDAAVAVVGRALAGPLGASLGRCAASARVGSDSGQVWAPLREEPALVPLARALDAAATRGTSPIPALRSIAADARMHARWAAQGRARALGARAAAPLGLCFLPAFVLLAVVPLVATSSAGLF